MAAHQKDPLRPLTSEERLSREQVSRSHIAPAAGVARATELLAVAGGTSFEAAAHAAGRKSGDAVAHLVARFNREGLDALTERHGAASSRGIRDRSVSRRDSAERRGICVSTRTRESGTMPPCQYHRPRARWPWVE